ncbi:hypothetical protein L1G94_000518 [Escherichia coli]|nr:hypothetical protein [Escherichia coli]
MIHIKVGQCAVTVAGVRYVFTPSFAAMAKIENSIDLVQAFAIVHGGKYPNRLPVDPVLRNRIMARCYGEMVQTSVLVLKACADSDISHLTGECKITPSGKLKLRHGIIPVDDVITLAKHLLFHGLIGDGPENKAAEQPQEGDYTPAFDVLEYVYSAVAHLGLSESEAWNMTMTGYRAAVRAKTPPDERNEKRKPNVQINKRDYDEQMEAAKRVLELMKKREQEKARN